MGAEDLRRFFVLASALILSSCAVAWPPLKPAESKPVPKRLAAHVPRWLAAHSLTVLLAVTGLGWLVAFARMDPNSKWGQVVGNVLSEWVQLIGVVLLTKSFLERGSAESRGK